MNKRLPGLPDMELLLTAEELGRVLKVPKRSIYKFAKEGLIPGTFRLGKHWRFRRAAIEQWLMDDTRTVQAGAGK